MHLATAVRAGADRFATNDRSGFGAGITEIHLTYSEALPAR